MRSVVHQRAQRRKLNCPQGVGPERATALRKLQQAKTDAASVQIQSPRLEIQELAALVCGELFFFEQQ
jgi:hypothetical protein